MKRSDLLEGIQKWREKFRHLPEKEKKRIFINQTMFLILKEPSLICEPLTEVLKAMKESSIPGATDSRLKKLGFSILTHNESGFDTWYPLLSEKMAEIGTAHSSREDPNWRPIKLYVEEAREPKVATYADVLKAMKEISDDGIPEGFGDSVFYDVVDPHSGDFFPVKAIWGYATGQTAYDFNAVQAKYALERLGFMVLDRRKKPPVTDAFDETAVSTGVDGAMKQSTSNRYERDPKLRRSCIEYYVRKDGHLKCQVCNLDFSHRYGEIGRGFIHVHHLNPLGERQEEQGVDATTDLVPVCPNCHAMLHKKSGKGAYALEHIRRLIEENLG